MERTEVLAGTKVGAFQLGRRFGVDLLQELDPLLVPVLGHAGSDQLALRQLDCGEHRGLLVGTEHQGVFRRVGSSTSRTVQRNWLFSWGFAGCG